MQTPEVASTSSNVDAIDIEVRILELCEKSPVGITNEILEAAIPSCTAEHRVVALNRLISQCKIELLKQGQTILYRLKDPNVARVSKGADNEEKLVYQIVERAGDKGIWMRDIRNQSNISITQVNKILKNLESKRFIKSVTPVNASKKKIYMLYNLEPNSSITGGSWYSDQEFESEFVDVLNQQCYRYLQQSVAVAKSKDLSPLAERNASYRSSTEIWEYITDLKISKVKLSLFDIESILNTLIYDGKVEKKVLGDIKLYRVLPSLISNDYLMSLPCGTCPVLNDCHEGGQISPHTCEYITEFLKF